MTNNITNQRKQFCRHLIDGMESFHGRVLTQAAMKDIQRILKSHNKDNVGNYADKVLDVLAKYDSYESEEVRCGRYY